MTAKKAPDELSASSRKLWRKINKEWYLEIHSMLILREALLALDLTEKARVEVERDGISFQTESGFVRAHPMLKVERESRTQFLMAMRQLNFDIDSAGGGIRRDNKSIKFA